MQIVFIADGAYSDYNKFMRAATVAIEGVRDQRIQFVSLGSRNVHDMIVEYVGKTRKFLRSNGINLSDGIVAYSPFTLDKDVQKVVVLNQLSYYPFKEYVAKARMSGVEVTKF